MAKKTKKDSNTGYVSGLNRRLSIIIFLIGLLIALVSGVIYYLIVHFNFLGMGKYFKNGLRQEYFILYIIISTALGNLLTSFIVKQIIKPIDKVSHSIDKILNEGTTEKINESHHIPAIQGLYDTHNRLIDELNAVDLIGADFISAVSHELKTPLASIQGYAQLIQKKDLDEETKNQYLNRIIKSSQDISEVSSSILLLAKYENNSSQRKKEKFSLDELIRQTILEQRPSWEEKNIEFDIAIESIELEANLESYHIIIQNLVSNAIKYNKDNGKISITLKNTDVLELIVADTGIGISEEDIDKIFNRFYQAETSRSSQGTGLGLAITKQLVKNIGGTITCESELGVGTSFKVTVPKP